VSARAVEDETSNESTAEEATSTGGAGSSKPRRRRALVVLCAWTSWRCALGPSMGYRSWVVETGEATVVQIENQREPERWVGGGFEGMGTNGGEH
jgi:hypothetical protein